jgi:hypothetical protein
MPQQQQQQHAMRIAFCHPDLGIGGAPFTAHTYDELALISYTII